MINPYLNTIPLGGKPFPRRGNAFPRPGVTLPRPGVALPGHGGTKPVGGGTKPGRGKNHATVVQRHYLVKMFGLNKVKGYSDVSSSIVQEQDQFALRVKRETAIKKVSSNPNLAKAIERLIWEEDSNIIDILLKYV